VALVDLTGHPLVPIGPGYGCPFNSTPGSASQVANAVGAAVISIGQVITADGGSHTIDTTGSSSLGWRTGTCTFASASTTVKVGLAAVDTAAGPPGRAVNVADTITFDVSKTMIGGGGGIVTQSWQTHVPDAGTKTIANGDLVAFCVQMTARGGTDSIGQGFLNNAEQSRPSVTSFTGGLYSSVTNVPNTIITFADGAIGYFYAGEVFSVLTNRSFSSGEYGQLFNLPFPLKIHGLYAWMAVASSAADADLVLYSAPLSTPVAEKTVSVDSNTITTLSGRRMTLLFATPYTYIANSDVAVAIKPTAGLSATAYYKTLASATHRVTGPFGTSSYGVTRSSGAFANANASLDHYFIGLLAGAFDAGGAGGGGGFSGFVG
jgi:hypothetical protein